MRIRLDFLKANDHPFWVILQQFVSRGFAGLKFLLVARLLGPGDMGLISVALVSLSIIELLTQLGVMEGIIQRKNKLETNQENALWTLMVIRGIGIGLIILVATPLIIKLFKAESAVNLLLLTAAVPLFTNSVSIKVYTQMRERNYKSVSILQLVTIIIDLVLSIGLVIYLSSPIGVIIGQLISQVIRTILSFTMFKHIPRIQMNMKIISDIRQYGKWIWANSVSTLILFQLDKVFASNYLGTLALGYYQTSQKLAQMGISDVSYALGQYYLPIFSKLNRENSVYLRFNFLNMLFIISFFSIFTSIYVWINSNTIIEIILGPEWLGISSLLGLMLISASASGILNVFVTVLRSIGKPKITTLSSYVQLIVYIPLAIVGVVYYQVYGLVIASILGVLIATIILIIYCLRKVTLFYKINFFKDLIEMSIVLLLFFLINLFLFDNLTFVFSSVVYVYILIKLFFRLKYKRDHKQKSEVADMTFQIEK
jgi:O-antigen/teichoic acid export membrane protein